MSARTICVLSCDGSLDCPARFTVSQAQVGPTRDAAKLEGWACVPMGNASAARNGGPGTGPWKLVDLCPTHLLAPVHPSAPS